MINKDFLRQILVEEKRLLENAKLVPVVVPKYAELNVKDIYESFKDDKLVMSFFPDKLPEGRLPDRTYMFNILNSVYPEYVS